MRKTIKISILTVIIAAMLLALALPACAKNSSALVVDKEGLFTSYEEDSLSSRLYTLSEKYQCELVIVTVSSFGSYSAEDYAENYYDTHGYGYGSDASGVLLLISKSERYYYICTTGKGEDAFNKTAFKKLSNEVKSWLSEDECYKAANSFINVCDQTLSDYEINGASFDTSSFLTGILVSAIIGLIAAIITVLVLKHKMNNARPQNHATYYERDNSFDLRISNDVYLYSTVRRVAKPKNNSSSSGGRSHGGGGGRF